MMEEKSEIDRIRDAAFSVEIKKGGTEDDDPIVSLIPVQGMMLVFKQRSIFRIQLPDEIDPERKYLKAKGSLTEIYKVGTQHPIVARTIVQANELIKSIILNGSGSKEELLDSYFDVFREMLPAYQIWEKLS